MARHGTRHDLPRTGEPPRVSAAMNVTPLIDVLLVLLVIFMAALPIVQKGISTDLPAPAVSAAAEPSAPIVVAVGADHRVTINHRDVAAGDLATRLRQIYGQRHDKTLFISAAAALRYRDVMDVIDTAKGAGVERVGIITASMERGDGR